MPCCGFQKTVECLLCVSERERNKRVEEKGETSWGEGQVECFHTCQDGMALVAAVSARLHVL
jgi:hypothetical protein